MHGGIDAVDRDLAARFDDGDFRAIVEDVTKRRPFTRWAPTFEKALAAMARGDHELAIPIWLAAIDGVCTAELGVKVYSQAPKPDGRESMRAMLLGDAPAMVWEPQIIAWLEVLVGFTGEPTATGVALLNRHAVMHGERPEIGTRKDAVQCLLALQVLAYLLDVRDRSAPLQ
jgi:hypothetical protein